MPYSVDICEEPAHARRQPRHRLQEAVIAGLGRHAVDDLLDEELVSTSNRPDADGGLESRGRDGGCVSHHESNVWIGCSTRIGRCHPYREEISTGFGE
jgi:hypothetical protein